MSEPVMIAGRGDGVKIQLAQWGQNGKAVLCIHGITANCRCWDVVASSLEKGVRVLAMDLRGRGRSDKPASGYSVDQHCRDIVALLDDLGLKRPVIMGHSLGAFIALAFGPLCVLTLRRGSSIEEVVELRGVKDAPDNTTSSLNDESASKEELASPSSSDHETAEEVSEGHQNT